MDVYSVITLLILKSFPSSNYIGDFYELIDKRDKTAYAILKIINENENIETEIIPKIIELNKELWNKVMELFLFNKVSFYNKDFIMNEFIKLKTLVKDTSLEDFIALYKNIESFFQEEGEDEDGEIDTAPSILLLDTYKEWEEHDLIGLGKMTVMGATTGWGKTTTTTSLILDILRNNNDIDVLYCGSMEIDKKEMRMKLGNLLLGENLFALEKQIMITEKEIMTLKDKYDIIRNKTQDEITNEDIEDMIRKMIKWTLSLEEKIFSLKKYKDSLLADIEKLKLEIKELEKQKSNNYIKQQKEKLEFYISEKQNIIDKTDKDLDNVKGILEKFLQIQKEENPEQKVIIFKTVFNEILNEISEKENKLKKLKKNFREKDNILKNHIYMKRIKILINSEKILIETVLREIKRSLNKGKKLMVFIDYLQLLSSKKDTWTLKEAQNISMALLDIAKKNKSSLGLFILTQFNSKKVKGDFPTHEDIYWYTIISQNMDSFLTLINLEKTIKSKDIDYNKTPITKMVATKNRKRWWWEEYYFKFERAISKLTPIPPAYKRILKENNDIAYYEDLVNSGWAALWILNNKKEEQVWTNGIISWKIVKNEENTSVQQNLLEEVF